MKSIILLLSVVMTLSFNNLKSQVTSSCDVPVSLKESHEDIIKALAIERVNQTNSPDKEFVRIPGEWMDTIAKGLAAIYNATSIIERDYVFDVYCAGKPLETNLTMEMDTSAQWVKELNNADTLTGNAYIDTIITKYNFTIDYHEGILNNYLYLSTDSIWNLEVLIDTFELDTTIIKCERSLMVGDYGNISYNKSGNNMYFDFDFGYGDCPSGCINHIVWSFIVDDQCNVYYQGSFMTEGNDPLPEPLFYHCNPTLMDSLKIKGKENKSRVFVGDTLLMETIVYPDYTTNKSVTWSVQDDTGAASMDSTGKLIGISAGKVKVIAKAKDESGATDSIDINVIMPVLVNSITLPEETNEERLYVDSIIQMTAIIEPDSATNKSISWTVEKETGNAIISNTGLLKGISKGTVNVIAVANDESGISVSKKVFIEDYIMNQGKDLKNLKFFIYPNPSRGEINIVSSNFVENMKIRVYDNKGKIVFEKSDLSGTRFSFNFPMTTGVYVNEIIVDNHSYRKTFIKE